MSTPLVDFSRVRYSDEVPAAESCAVCGRGLVGEYFLAGDQRVCGTCAANVQTAVPADSHGAYARGMLWAVPAAVLGMIVYAGFEIGTGLSIGYLAIGVGYSIAKAMKHGSGGRGGRRYQWSAMLLTYAAVAMAFLPVAIVQDLKGMKAKEPAAELQRQKAGPVIAASGAKSPPLPVKRPVLMGLTLLLGLGLISPFLQLMQSTGSGLIGLLILFWGMQAAWKLMASERVPVDGPFPVTPA